MSLFPSLWELWLPNWNLSTTIGIVLLVVGVLALFFGSGLPFAGVLIKKVAWILILIGVFLVFILSMLQDFISSTGGALITGGVFIVIVFWFLLFYEPKK